MDWAGRLREDDFLARLYDLSAMPSTDHRMSNAAGDTHQQRVNWRDWRPKNGLRVSRMASGGRI